MNKKGNGWAIVIIVILVAIIVFTTLYFKNLFGFKEIANEQKDKVENIVLNKQSELNKPEEFVPPPDLSWCVSQHIPTGENDYNPQEIFVAGEDTTEHCCMYIYTGVNNCINQTQSVTVCLTARIGGTIKYVKVDDRYKEPSNYEAYIENLDKSYNPSYFGKCDSSIY
jgi:hypothetical protein|tara:strand:+ start:3849 stop:4352 length:504 start_codon:yes stop_codon:yes gene_type:complete